MATIPLSGASTRYERETPYEELGVSTSATPNELRDKFAEKEAEIRDSGQASAERARLGERLKAAYDALSTGARRVRVDFFLVEPRVGLMQARTAAEALPKPNLSLEGVVKPRTLRVTHEALWDDLEAMRRDPPRVEGLHPKTIDIPLERELPPPLAFAFDC